MADRLLIVDGDNVAHLRGGPPERIREDLVADTSALVEPLGWDAVIVFDGHGGDRTIGRVAIRHAGGESADSVIERLAHRGAEQRPVTVVSSDAVLRHVVHRGGVEVISAREFADGLASAHRDTPSEQPDERNRYRLGEALDPAVQAALERIRRGSGNEP